jgi:hypothetical protein
MQPPSSVFGGFEETLLQKPIVEKDPPRFVMPHHREMMPAVVARAIIV